jgi:hypothetical protein
VCRNGEFLGVIACRSGRAFTWPGRVQGRAEPACNSVPAARQKMLSSCKNALGTVPRLCEYPRPTEGPPGTARRHSGGASTSAAVQTGARSRAGVRQHPAARHRHPVRHPRVLHDHAHDRAEDGRAGAGQPPRRDPQGAGPADPDGRRGAGVRAGTGPGEREARRVPRGERRDRRPRAGPGRRRTRGRARRPARSEPAGAPQRDPAVEPGRRERRDDPAAAQAPRQAALRRGPPLHGPPAARPHQGHPGQHQAVEQGHQPDRLGRPPRDRVGRRADADAHVLLPQVAVQPDPRAAGRHRPGPPRRLRAPRSPWTSSPRTSCGGWPRSSTR